MPGVGKRFTSRVAERGALAEFALSQQQIDFVAQPHTHSATLIGPEAQPEPFVGRPWFVWKGDFKLAQVQRPAGN